MSLLHESISREHAAIILDELKGAMIVDLGSTTGTRVNGKSVIDHTGIPIKDGDEIVFGASTRSYKVTIDYSRLRKSLEAKQKALQNEIEAIATLSDSRIEDLRIKLGSSMVDTLYVGNLPYHYEESDVRNLFRGCGQIVKVELRKGFAFV